MNANIESRLKKLERWVTKAEDYAPVCTCQSFHFEQLDNAIESLQREVEYFKKCTGLKTNQQEKDNAD